MKLTACGGRSLNYLRLSVTDRCNLRCKYCMPPEGIESLSCSDVLSFEEIIRSVELLAELGITKIRVTGGEPLVRTDVTKLVASIKQVSGIQEVALTTNGQLLDQLAQPLKDAGLDRLNISLDTLDPDRYNLLTGGGSLTRFWQGVKAAQAAGFANLKFNFVVMKGFNDDELGQAVLLAQDNPWQVRFIEYMPMAGQANAWQAGYLPYREIEAEAISQVAQSLGITKAEISSRWIPAGISGTARIVKPIGFQGSLGFISPIGEHFCDSCNRLRLSSDGQLHACLLEEGNVDLRNLLRNGTDAEKIKLEMQAVASLKPQRHGVTGNSPGARKKMSRVGG